jgi:hypothetical protein
VTGLRSARLGWTAETRVRNFREDEKLWYHQWPLLVDFTKKVHYSVLSRANLLGQLYMELVLDGIHRDKEASKQE